MKHLYYLSFLIAIVLAPSLCAQPIILQLTPQEQALETGQDFFLTAEFQVKVLVEEGYVGPVELSASTPTLTMSGEGATVTPNLLNLPYEADKEATVTVRITKQSVGKHDIIIKGKLLDGASAEETATITVNNVAPSVWAIYEKEEGPLAVDKEKGICWIAAKNGLRQFDGKEWSEYAWPSDVPEETSWTRLRRLLTLDKDGNVWITFIGGSHLIILQYREQELQTEYIEGDQSRINWIIGPTEPRYTMVNDNGHLYIFSTVAGLWVFDGTSLSKSQIPDGDIHMGTPVFDSQKNAWIRLTKYAGQSNGIMKMDKQGVIKYLRYPTHSDEQEVIGGVTARIFSPVGIDHQDNLIVRINDLDRETIRFDEDLNPTTITTGILSNHMRSITRGKENDLWINLAKARLDRYNGIARYDGTNEWHYTTANSELPSDSTTVVAVDQNGMVWIESSSYLVLLDGNIPPNEAYTASVPVRKEANFSLSVAPNPLSDISTISFSLDQRADVHLRMINSLGQEITRITDGMYEAGEQSILLQTEDLVPGMYFLQLNVDDQMTTRPIIVTH